MVKLGGSPEPSGSSVVYQRRRAGLVWKSVTWDLTALRFW
jgi:hypothetical protein